MNAAAAVGDGTGGEPVGGPGGGIVLHSQEYNAALQRTLLRVGGSAAAEIVVDAAAQVTQAQLVPHLLGLGAGGADPETRLGEVADLFARCGMGALDLSGIGEEGGIATASPALDAAPRPEGERPTEPECLFAVGYLRGALAAVYGRAFEVRETRCSATGARACRFEVRPTGGATDLPASLAGATSLTTRSGGDERERSIARLLFAAPLAPDANGRIHVQGSLFTRVWADFYARACYGFERELPRVKGNKYTHMAAVVLAETGHLCAYHTLGGILRSDGWARQMTPHLPTPEELLRAAVSLVNVLGWGHWSVQALLPDTRLIVRIEESYEAVGHLRHFGAASRPKCYFAQGVAAGLMNLVYPQSPLPSNPDDPTAYNSLFRSPTSFRAREIACVAEGAPACEIVATRLSAMM